MSLVNSCMIDIGCLFRHLHIDYLYKSIIECKKELTLLKSMLLGWSTHLSTLAKYRECICRLVYIGVFWLSVLYFHHVSHLSLISCSQLHTSELNDGYDWGRLNLQSVTEQSSMDDFLATAELAGTEFVAGKWHTRLNWNTKILGCVCCHPECLYLYFPRETQHSVCASRS